MNNKGEMVCYECSKINNFPYDFCCLHECGKHEFCKGCINLDKNKERR